MITAMATTRLTVELSVGRFCVWENFAYFFMIRPLNKPFKNAIIHSLLIERHNSIKKWIIPISQMQHRTPSRIGTQAFNERDFV